MRWAKNTCERKEKKMRNERVVKEWRQSIKVVQPTPLEDNEAHFGTAWHEWLERGVAAALAQVVVSI